MNRRLLRLRLSAAVSAALAVCAPCRAAEISLDVSAPVRAARTEEKAPSVSSCSAVPGSFREAAGGSVEAALDSLPGLDLQRRGAPGAQADLSLRGSSYQQALLLIDGMRANDPQTAHHNLDLPFAAADIEAVEVLPGAHASGLGAGAFGGAVNVRTRRPSSDGAYARAGAGEYSSRFAEVSCERVWGAFGQRISGRRGSSGGARPGAGSEAVNIFSRSAYDAPWGTLDLSAGYTEKDFGAAGFYSSVTREEREATRTRFASVSARVGGGEGLAAEPRVYWRAHHDRFSYLYNSAAYANVHDTGLAGAGLTLRRKSGGASVSLGGEYYGENIDSSNMGRHSAGVTALSGGWESRLGGAWSLAALVRADRHTAWGWQGSPGVRLGWGGSGGPAVWAAAGRSFRAPSFTELYYNDPGNRGNALLKPERAVSYEAGAEWAPGVSRLRSAVYRRDESRIIDWVKTAAGSPWTARNIGGVTVHGLEGSFETALGKARMSLAWSFIYKDSSASYQSKYALRYPRGKGALSLKGPLPWGLDSSLALSAVKREKEAGYFLADLGLARQFGNMRASFDVTNILDAGYEEIPGAPAPGRWSGFSLGCAFN